MSATGLQRTARGADRGVALLIILASAALAWAVAMNALDVRPRTLLESPLETAPLRVLALESARQGQMAEAARLMALVDARTRRDAIAQSWLLDQALAKRDA